MIATRHVEPLSLMDYVSILFDHVVYQTLQMNFASRATWIRKRKKKISLKDSHVRIVQM